METLLINIGSLLNVREISAPVRGNKMSELPTINNAYLRIEDGIIISYGPMQDLYRELDQMPPHAIDLTGRIVMPAWCDSHTHIVFQGSRENEFRDKIAGKTYAEIAANGGGILNSAKRLATATEDELFQAASARLEVMKQKGTGAVEIKSGYGLDVEQELKMLRVIRRLQKESDVIIRSTFLGAHTYPEKYKQDHDGYIRLIEEEMIPAIASEGLADFIDVFCEEGFFSPTEMKRILDAGRKAGLTPKVHVNQLHSIGGIEAAIEANALSLDHLEVMTEQDIRLMGQYQGFATLLPTAAFFLRMPMQPGRALIDAGAAVALATDHNPGSSPSGDMNFAAAISCIQMKLFPEELINAGTINGAYAMGIGDIAGSVTVGKIANLIVTKPVPSLAFLFYRFTDDHIEDVMIRGNWVRKNAV
jgi:imidazolonepropionase